MLKLMPDGQAVTECPLSTSDGVKAIDVTWISPAREENGHHTRRLHAATPSPAVSRLQAAKTLAHISGAVVAFPVSGLRLNCCFLMCEADVRLTRRVNEAGLICGHLVLPRKGSPGPSILPFIVAERYVCLVRCKSFISSWPEDL
jgi:hypothetical protein